MEDMVWHFTTGQKYVLIQQDGKLKRAAIGVSYPELPILWFSAHKLYEPSALKLLVQARRQATLEELREIGMGVFRYGVPKSSLIPWPELATKARMSRSMTRKLESRAVQMGSDPSDWYGSLEDLPIKDMVIQRMNDEHQWDLI
ncbi:hypothetical protein EDC30_1197 [Paucimonas lemoignei]|uniref:Uncharacterized protein n=1 Tax=Paucimonas lemoignei TaxID=29443 RepID=A0A4R3HPI5_PAULE|nr:hypothetical protein [Paucimonas lemoignei]TCS32896.1 hypothetical protein EDC30_1197 [Paucimonas lemoignei]